jgi:hypothetical protein
MSFPWPNLGVRRDAGLSWPAISHAPKRTSDSRAQGSVSTAATSLAAVTRPIPPIRA